MDVGIDVGMEVGGQTSRGPYSPNLPPDDISCEGAGGPLLRETVEGSFMGGWILLLVRDCLVGWD
ncbi:MAG: hypothetical protein BYD32DRAFT_424308 [Podila humilis]|nr:MAG: hypothetical protein BYD32DRAFT_424308 [Podila humilis]